MIANIVDLRYKMKDVLKAIDRQERVEIVYRGKAKAVIVPASNHSKRAVVDHPLFGRLLKEKKSVSQVMDDLRGGRYRAV